MWHWAFHVRHNWQANLPREEIKKVETLWQKQSERKGKVPKSYDKSYHNKKRKQLTKEGIVSFWRLRKVVRTKAWNFWLRRAQFPFGDSVSKAGESRKAVIDKSNLSSHGPYLPISQGGRMTWLGIGFCQGRLSQKVSHFPNKSPVAYLTINRSPLIIFPYYLFILMWSSASTESCASTLGRCAPSISFPTLILPFLFS